ncbi:hypothetical protein BDW69DRAFT_170434 [Aspergillus filifer]
MARSGPLCRCQWTFALCLLPTETDQTKSDQSHTFESLTSIIVIIILILQRSLLCSLPLSCLKNGLSHSSAPAGSSLHGPIPASLDRPKEWAQSGLCISLRPLG